MKYMMIAANWKMNKTIDDALRFIHDFKPSFRPKPNREILICPTNLCLALFKQEFENTPIGIGAQNCYHQSSGAFTGEVSPAMLKHAGCGYCIVGHSERRTLFQETDEDVAKKVKALQEEDLIPIACIGETEQERAQGETFSVIGRQLRAILEQHTAGKKLVIAYEPVWAIGTGKVASLGDIHQAHRFIREKLIAKLGEPGNHMNILYGGSVNPQNAKEIEGVEDVSGFLIGGASLKVSSLLEIY